MSVRVIAIGEALASDDGVAFAVLEALKRQSLPTGVEAFGSRDASRLVDLLSGTERVIIVDAIIATPGSVRVLRPEDLLRPAAASLSSHGMSVQEALELARTLHSNDAAQDIAIVAIGIDKPLAYGTSLSAAVAAAIPVAVGKVLELIAA